jgi:extracellular factor (EF) 3-hydroxypalmitic acid methyl ester biosynthesis protein
MLCLYNKNLTNGGVGVAKTYTEKRSVKRDKFIEDKRLLKRVSDDSLSVEINLPFPKGYKLIKPIAELNNKGFSFYLSSEEGFFEKGRVLNDIKFFNHEYEIMVDKGKVVYSKLYEGDSSSNYKIGVEFLFDKNITDKEIFKDIVFKKRAKRFKNNNIKLRISFFVDGAEQRAQILDFSKTGISLLIKSPKFIIRKSDVLKNIDIRTNEKTIYKGDGIILDIQEKNDAVKLRVNLRKGFIPVENILGENNKNRVDYEISKLKELVYAGEIVSKEFKDNISKTHYLLINIKSQLDDFENSIKDYDIKAKNILINEMFKKIEKEMYPKLDKCIRELDEIFKNINKKEFDFYRTYFQNNLHLLFMLAPILNRIYTKPLNIAGDYEMINMLYENQYQGLSIFGKFLHKYICSDKTSHAIRTRTEFMYKKIQNILNKNIKKNKNKFKITSIASGSGLEIQELIKYEKNTDYSDITLFDFSKEAIEYSEIKINKIIKNYNRKTNVNFIQESIFNLIRDKNVLNKIANNQDIIYSIGLFEYLTDSTCKILIKTLYEKLKKNGVLIIGNYKYGVPLRSWMELGVDWYLVYRENKNLISFADNNMWKQKIFTEKTKLFNFLILVKK